jgi:hypothetical protein
MITELFNAMSEHPWVSLWLGVIIISVSYGLGPKGK